MSMALSTILDSSQVQVWHYDNKDEYERDRRIYAKTLARRVHGYEGTGVRDGVMGPKGLSRLANNYLKTLGNGARVREHKHDELKSIYTPYWK